MPILGYECAKCKKEFEVFYTSQAAVQREEKAEKCPHCKAAKKKRLAPTNTSFQLKGRGWYKDGY